jgi:hypothetical protein
MHQANPLSAHISHPLQERLDYSFRQLQLHHNENHQNSAPGAGSTAARVPIQDTSYYALFPEPLQFPHEKYVNNGSAGDTESKIYLIWDVEIAKHSGRVWEGILGEVRRLVEAGGGKFVKGG